ncbi:MAG: hypothetical protein RSB87_06195 [Clostridia bacterium]
MNKKGFSLIVLGITITVMIILATVTLLSLSKDNSIEHAKESVFKADVDEMGISLEQTIGALQIKDSNLERKSINVSRIDNMKQYIPKFPAKYENVFEIQSGLLVYVGKDPNQLKWAKELNILPKVANTSGFTLNKAESTSTLPYIPEAMYYVGGTADTGLVVSDKAQDKNKGVNASLIGSQFVWIPVDGVNVEFKPKFNQAESETMGGFKDIEDIDKARNSIAVYGGFYMGRYEATEVSSKPVMAKGKNVVTNIKYVDAKKRAEAMYESSTDIVSTLPYGTMWDTVLNWFIQSGAITPVEAYENSTSWGTYPSSKQPSGMKMKNQIFDVAGNVAELTKEVVTKGSSTLGSTRAYRGGVYTSAEKYASARNPIDLNAVNSMVGYRVALYIK